MRGNLASSNEGPQWGEAKVQAAKGCSEGPHFPTHKGRLFWGEKEISVNPILRFGAQQGGDSRVSGDVEISETRGAVAVPPILRPHGSGDLAVQEMSSISSIRSGSRRRVQTPTRAPGG